jgi:6-bladed beta-propeller
MSRTGCWACLLLVLSGCGYEPASRVTVTDSAGVRVTVTVDTSAAFATLDSVPIVSIGGPDAAGPNQFFRVQNILVDKARRIWVADGQSNEVRIFDANGAHWKTRGGRGEGPGEFLQIRLLGTTRGDSVLTGDYRTEHITVFDPEGEFVRTQRLPSSDRPAPRPFDVFPDGSILGQLPRIVAAASLEPGQVLPDSVELVRVGLDSTFVESYGAASGPLWLWTGRNQVPLPFTVNASFDVVGSAVHIVSGPHFRVRVFEGGRLRESYGVQREPREVGASDVDAYRTFVEDYIPEQMRPDYLTALDNELRPSLLPAYDRVLASTDGHVWAQVYESDLGSPHGWDVFDGPRRFVGRVHVASGFYPMVITADAVVGVWRDPMGVEYVRTYRFTRI